jgi:hypothetical protein
MGVHRSSEAPRRRARRRIPPCLARRPAARWRARLGRVPAKLHGRPCERTEPRGDLFQAIIAGYRKSKAYANLGARTRADYDKHIARIEAEFASLPLDALDDPRVTVDFTKWRDRQSGGPRQQDYAWMVPMRLRSWAAGKG